MHAIMRLDLVTSLTARPMIVLRKIRTYERPSHGIFQPLVLQTRGSTTAVVLVGLLAFQPNNTAVQVTAVHAAEHTAAMSAASCSCT